MNRELIAKTLRKIRGERTRDKVAIANLIRANELQMYETRQRIPKAQKR